jgi:hypothetical protein
MYFLICCSVLAFLGTVLFAIHQWKERKIEVRDTVTNRNERIKELRSNTVNAYVTCLMAFIASTVAVYSSIDQEISARKGSFFQSELNKKTDTIRDQGVSLEIANKKIVKLQSDNLDSASKIIAEQSRLLSKSMDILELSNENSKHLMGDGCTFQRN